MGTRSESRRTVGRVAVAALLLAALATLALGPASPSGGATSVARRAGQASGALDALRTVSFAGLHQAAHLGRTRAPLPTTGPMAAAAHAIAGLGALCAAIALRSRGSRRWWGGRCWRAPPSPMPA